MKIQTEKISSARCDHGHLVIKKQRHCKKCTFAYELLMMKEMGLTNHEIISELGPQDIDRMFLELVGARKEEDFR